MNILIFDIETIPDVETGRKLLSLTDLSDEEVAMAMMQMRRQEVDHDFLPHYLQRIVAISAVIRQTDSTRNKFKVWSLGETNSPESELIQRFFDGLEKLTPTLVSWNGSGFDLPVLHYRALLHGIQAPRYWETGDHDQSFRFNNYLNRYHNRHLDLMDVLSGYQGRAAAPLDNIAKMLGFPGKMGKSGSQVWQQYFAGELEAIRDYCETDVLNTYLVFLRFELIRGKLNAETYEAELELVKDHLLEANKPHLNEFLDNWIGEQI
ncbi:MAG: 3'-5' exonuclease [Gammaproteobacteria bacterium]|nr:3'-5' exonuclease [Gammaproteobacteria bacterium]